MKLSTRDITILKVFGIIVVVTLMVVTMFYPEYIRNPYSIKEIENKQEEVSSLNNTIMSNESIISSDSTNLEQLRKDVSSLETEYKRMESGLVDTEFKLHIPSILVTLEQTAKSNELEIMIDYENINQHGGNPDDMGVEYHDDFDHDDDFGLIEDYIEDELTDSSEELGQGGDELSDEEQIDNEPAEAKDEISGEDILHEGNLAEEQTTSQSASSGLSEEHSEITEEAVQINIPSIHGVNVTTVKIKLNGSYENIRNFIFAIDEIDFIENNVIDLLSYGESMSAVIMLNIFHTEDGGGIN